MFKLHSPSPTNFSLAIIHMYEYKTCEIPLLSHKNQTLRPPPPTVLFLQTNLDNSTQATRSSSCSSADKNLPPSLSGEIHSSESGSPSPPYFFAKLPVPLSSSSRHLSGSTQLTEISKRFAHSIGRWDAISFPPKTLGPLSGRSEILYRKNGCFFRSHTSSRQRGRISMGSRIGSHSNKSTT